VNRHIKNLFVVAFIALILMLLMKTKPLNSSMAGPKTVGYSTAWKQVQDGKIASGTFKKDQFVYESKKGVKYVTNLDQNPEERSKFQDLLRSKDV